MLVEVEAKSPALSQLRQIVIQRLFANPHFVCCFFETHSSQLVILVHVTIVKLAPLGNLLYYVANRSLLSPLGFFILLANSCPSGLSA